MPKHQIFLIMPPRRVQRAYERTVRLRIRDHVDAHHRLPQRHRGRCLRCSGARLDGAAVACSARHQPLRAQTIYVLARPPRELPSQLSITRRIGARAGGACFDRGGGDRRGGGGGDARGACAFEERDGPLPLRCRCQRFEEGV